MRDDDLLDIKGLAEKMKYSTHHVTRRIITLPDFPTPFYSDASRRTHPRWLVKDVNNWIAKRIRKAA